MAYKDDPKKHLAGLQVRAERFREILARYSKTNADAKEMLTACEGILHRVRTGHISIPFEIPERHYFSYDSGTLTRHADLYDAFLDFSLYSRGDDEDTLSRRQREFEVWQVQHQKLESVIASISSSIRELDMKLLGEIRGGMSIENFLPILIAFIKKNQVQLSAGDLRLLEVLAVDLNLPRELIYSDYLPAQVEIVRREEETYRHRHDLHREVCEFLPRMQAYLMDYEIGMLTFNSKSMEAPTILGVLISYLERRGGTIRQEDHDDLGALLEKAGMNRALIAILKPS